MEKSQELQGLYEEMARDATLPLQAANLVVGEGNIDSEVVFIGEAPGQKEDELKRPFVGRSGQLLNKLLEEIGWKREEVYITNIVKRRPPDNRDPEPAEIEAYKPYLTRQLAILKPLVVVTLGRFSMNYFLPLAKISKDHGKVFRTQGLFVVPFYHPAAALRAGAVMEELRLDFKKLPIAVKACRAYIPPTKKGGAASTEGENNSSQFKLFEV